MRPKTNQKEEEAKAHIRSSIKTILERLGVETRGQKYRCVISGHEDSNPSASVFCGDDGVFRLGCRVCEKNLDAIDVVRSYYEKHRGVSLSFPQAIEECKRLLAMPLETIPSSKGVQSYPLKPLSDSSPIGDPLASKKEANLEIVEKFKEGVQPIDPKGEGAKYLESRSISLEVASEMLVGEVKEYRHPSSPKGKREPVLAFTLCSYDAQIKGFIIRYSRAREKKVVNRVEGQGGFFGADSLRKGGDFFLTEGEMDALSYAEIGHKAVSFGSCGDVSKFLAMLKKMKFEGYPLPRFMISSDRDSNGEKAQLALSKGLEDLGAIFSYATLPNGAKDANEALMESREAFEASAKKSLEDLNAAKALLSESTEEEKEDPKEKTKVSIKTANEELLGMFREKPQPPLKTGFKNLDQVLDGGFRSALSVLMGEPGTGKTTLALQIADNIAREGGEVLIFSLEMSRRDLIYKSLSRMSYKMAEEQYPTGRGNTEDRKSLSLKATYFQDRYYIGKLTEEAYVAKASIEAYTEAIGARITIVSGVGGVTIEGIEQYLNTFKAQKGIYPSLVIIDYIQRIKGEKGLSDKQIVDNSITELCNYSHSYDIPILGICSINRESYGGGSGRGMTLSSAKESGSIEFGASQILALETYVPKEAQEAYKKAQKEAAQKKTEAKSQDLTYEGFENGTAEVKGDTKTHIYSKLIQCRALKNRTGSRDRIFFDFKSPYNTFNELNPKTVKKFSEFYLGSDKQEKALYSEGESK